MSNRVLVVGGGTAGWLTALFLQKNNPRLKVELIESEEIGIVGAGESAPTSFDTILRECGIDHIEFIRETESTLKSSIRFDEWCASDSLYLNPIQPACKNFYPFTGNLQDPSFEDINIGDFNLFCYVNNINPNQFGPNKFAINNKAPYVYKNSKRSKISAHTLHINAKLAAKYLRKIAEQRGILRHEGKIIKINGEYPIESVEDDRGKAHKFDFIFDCSGFARLIIGKHLKSEWIDYSNILTVNSAIPFFIPTEKEIAPYTQTTAMKYGWMFKVPTKNRYGSGYIYNSDLISKEDAIKEVHEKLGYEVELVNHFNFRGGIYKEQVKSNCMALGLAAGFLEPMAATNLGSIAIGLAGLLKTGTIYNLKNETFAEVYNRRIQYFSEYRTAEIYMHYVTKRNDTEFWQHYKNRDNWPELFRQAYEQFFSDEKFEWRDFCSMIDLPAHTAMPKIVGNDWFRERAIKYAEKYNLNKQYYPIYEHMKQQTDILYPYAIDHREFLESL
jgi:tryptophan halogenase